MLLDIRSTTHLLAVGDKVSDDVDAQRRTVKEAKAATRLVRLTVSITSASTAGGRAESVDQLAS